MKNTIIRICISAVIFVAGILTESNLYLATALFLISYVVVGYKVIIKAVKGLFKGQVLDENFLMSVASIGAFIIGEYPEAVAVMLFYQVGEAFEDYAVGKSRKSITDLMNIRPDSANLKTEDGIEEVDPEDVLPGNLIVVRPGEKIPLDGKIIEGTSSLNTAALTGESMPREVSEGDEVLSGCVNLNGVLTIEVTKPFGESTASKILDLVENSINKKAKAENFITRFSVVYTPIVVGAAVVLAIVPPLIIPGAMWADWVYRALSFLVVSCPCALVISVPLSFFGGIGGASRAGILVKGSNYLEAMSKAEYVVMDKTGTLTEGVFKVEKIQAESGFSKEEVLKYAALAEVYSNHPISLSLKDAFRESSEEYVEDSVYETMVNNVSEVAGKGVIADVLGHKVAVGNKKLMAEAVGDEWKPSFDVAESADGATKEVGTNVYVAVNGAYAGRILLADKIKKDSKETIRELKKDGIKTVMLTGDNKETGEKIAGELGIDKVYAGLLPAAKVELLETFLHDKSEKGKVVFVGDGINDAPVLARADIGVAMGGLGSDAAIEAADMVIMNDNPAKLIDIIKISKKTMRIVKENIIFALGVKISVLILSAFGLVGLWAAVFADVGVSILAVLNALRCLSNK
jgi:Cd2+/Zn2+-exporting ATPase